MLWQVSTPSSLMIAFMRLWLKLPMQTREWHPIFFITEAIGIVDSQVFASRLNKPSGNSSKTFESRGIMDDLFNFKLSISISFKSLIFRFSPV